MTRARDIRMDQNAVCALCGRPFGDKVEMHHLVPKSLGGREVVPLHPMCHRKIHKTFRERELARHFFTIKALQDHPDIRQFIDWIATKPPDFYRRTEAPNGARRSRKGRR